MRQNGIALIGILLGVVGIGVVGSLFYLSLRQPATKSGQQTEPQQTAVAQGSANPRQTTATTTTTKGSTKKTIATGTFSLTYPSGWRAEEKPIAGGKAVYLWPEDNIANGSLYPKVFAEATGRSITSLESRKADFEKAGFLQTSTIFKESQAARFTKTIPVKIEKGKVVNAPVQSTFLLFEKNGMVYVLGYEYAGANKSETNEVTFLQILNTFTTQ